jgi:hypothetical protein
MASRPDCAPLDPRTRALSDLLVLTLHSLVLGWVARSVAALLRLVALLLVHEREYSPAIGSPAAYVAAELAVSEGAWFSTRMVTREGVRMAPGGVVVGRRLAFLALSTQIDRGFLSTVDAFVVFRWRWLPPLVPDSVEHSIKGDGAIAVMRQCSPDPSRAEWRRRTEVACPPCVPEGVAAASREAAALACSAVLALPRGARLARVLVCGPPGCGKSTSARLVADRLRAETGGDAVTLVAGFDPTRPGHSMARVLEEAAASAGPGSWVVVAMEEVECALRRLAAPSPTPTAAAVLPDVHDKQSWTAMMDMLQFVDRVVLVMTTNLSHSELDALDAEHHQGALLRAGRVTLRVAMSAGGSVEVL